MQHSDILALAGLRVDGRRPNEVRTIQHRFGVTSNCDGSVYMEQGLNKVLVAVCGPHEPAKRDNSAEKVCVIIRGRQLCLVHVFFNCRASLVVNL